MAVGPRATPIDDLSRRSGARDRHDEVGDEEARDDTDVGTGAIRLTSPLRSTQLHQSQQRADDQQESDRQDGHGPHPGGTDVTEQQEGGGGSCHDREDDLGGFRSKQSA